MKKNKKFDIGDIVEWKSQANSSWKTKRGEIIGRVPPGVRPEAVFQGHKLRDRGWGRSVPSYLVLVRPDKGNAKPKLYWPNASKLEKVTP